MCVCVCGCVYCWTVGLFVPRAVEILQGAKGQSATQRLSACQSAYKITLGGRVGAVLKRNERAP